MLDNSQTEKVKTTGYRIKSGMTGRDKTTGYRIKSGMTAELILTVIPAHEPESSGVGFEFLVDGQQSNTERQNHWIPDQVRYDGRVKTAGYRIESGMTGRVKTAGYRIKSGMTA